MERMAGFADREAKGGKDSTIAEQAKCIFSSLHQLTEQECLSLA
jgi:hypothetical protein